MAVNNVKFDAVNAQGNSTITNIGVIYAQTANIGTSSATSRAPLLEEQFSNVPLQRVAHFVERPNLRSRMKEQLHDALGKPVNQSKVVVMHGLGGVGKTQIAIDYIQIFRDDYKGIFWINASRRQTVEQELGLIYRLLFVPPNLGQLELPELPEMLLRIKNWFSKSPGNWLWVFDSADNVDDKLHPDCVDLKSFLPSALCVQTLITTRSSKVTKMTTPSNSIEIRDLEMQEALDLFWTTSGIDPQTTSENNRQTAKSIVEDLGQLALAVSLAGANVSESPTMSADISLYQTQYRKNRRAILEKRPLSLIEEYGESVLTTWETSFESVNRQSTLAGELLGFIALLDPDDIFIDIFAMAIRLSSTASRENYPNENWRWQSALTGGDEIDLGKIESAFAVLESFSLLRHVKGTMRYVLHRLVQAWAIERLEGSSQTALSCAVSDFLVTIILQHDHNPGSRSRIAKHVMANFTTITITIFPYLNGETISFLRQFYIYDDLIERLGLWRDCNAIRSFNLEQKVKILGSEHPSTISAMGNLASALLKQGKLKEAEKMEKEVVEKMRRVLGDEHKNTISAISNLAVILEDLGRSEEAALMKEEVLEKRRRILGDEHLDTILAMDNLANAYRQQEKLEEAASMGNEIVKKIRCILGDEHPDAIGAIGNLAITLRQQGKYEEAASMQIDLLEKGRRILGDDHPDTIQAMYNLAVTVSAQGKHENAASILEEALSRSRSVLGDENRLTISVQEELRILYDLQASVRINDRIEQSDATDEDGATASRVSASRVQLELGRRGKIKLLVKRIFRMEQISE